MIPDLRIDAEPSPAAQQLGRPAAPQVEESKETWHFVPIRTAKKKLMNLSGDIFLLSQTLVELQASSLDASRQTLHTRSAWGSVWFWRKVVFCFFFKKSHPRRPKFIESLEGSSLNLVQISVNIHWFCLFYISWRWSQPVCFGLDNRCQVHLSKKQLYVPHWISWEKNVLMHQFNLATRGNVTHS